MLDTMVIFSGVVNIILSGRMENTPQISMILPKKKQSFRLFQNAARRRTSEDGL